MHVSPRTGAKEKAETLRDARAVLFSFSVPPPFSRSLPVFPLFLLATSRPPSHSLTSSLSVRATCLYPRYSCARRWGFTGRRLAAHGRRSDLELLLHGVGTFILYQSGIRDEFNSDWSLSITSSLSDPFSLFAAISTRSTVSSRS